MAQLPHADAQPRKMTRSEQAALLAVTASHPRDHLNFSFALGTRLATGRDRQSAGIR